LDVEREEQAKAIAQPQPEWKKWAIRKSKEEDEEVTNRQLVPPHLQIRFLNSVYTTRASVHTQHWPSGCDQNLSNPRCSLFKKIELLKTVEWYKKNGRDSEMGISRKGNGAASKGRRHLRAWTERENYRLLQ